ncbi:hypothetical protein [Bradyrhizobium jicamae]|uniref:hypothetical protein n=1 Tax=Bradyrhizobium jicamae TaxID=280332 RepID=UPI000AB02BAE|nr:hypothetical protein [Bradyrhizobium jicamae]
MSSKFADGYEAFQLWALSSWSAARVRRREVVGPSQIPDQQIAVIACLTEGQSIRATERITGIHRI